MNGPVVVDTNLLLLLIVGKASPGYIGSHERLGDYGPDDFELLELLIAGYSDLVLLPNVMTEVSNFIGQIKEPARSDIRRVFKVLAQSTVEIAVPSAGAVGRREFAWLGLTDSAILQLCSAEMAGYRPTILTVDGPLIDAASRLDFRAVNFADEIR